MFFGAVRDMWRNCRVVQKTVQDPSGNGQANVVPERNPSVKQDVEIPDILQELITAAGQIEDGEYDAFVQEYNYGCTRLTTCSYVKFKLGIPGKRQSVWAFIAILEQQMPFFHYYVPKLLHRRVRIKIENRRFADQTYPTARIIRIID